MEFRSVSCASGVLSCFLLALAYVGSLYLWRSKLPRNHAKTIKRRFCSVLLVTLIAPPYVLLWADDTDEGPSLWQWLGLRLPGIIAASIIPLLLTMILFLGPIMMIFFDGISSYFNLTLLKIQMSGPLWWRNYLVAPFTEEFVFRACMLPILLACFGFNKAIFICPLFFGVAHVHHVIERLRLQQESVLAVWIQTLFQFCYTTVFGAYSAFLFLQTGHLISPVICHSFCNFMGFPEFDNIPSYGQPRSTIISISYIVGLIAFLCLLIPMTSPYLYSNNVYASIVE
ncbi:CAAX prenyl protease 2-like [Glandiceps talaboti]